MDIKQTINWVPSERLCKACPYGTILNKNTYQSCNEIKCQDSVELAISQNKKCPDAFKLVKLNEKFPEGYERFKNN